MTKQNCFFNFNMCGREKTFLESDTIRLFSLLHNAVEESKWQA